MHWVLVAAHGLSRLMACGIFLHQGLNPCPCIAKQILNPWARGKSLSCFLISLPSANRLSFAIPAFLFFLISTLYWSRVDLQCCDHFRHTAEWFSYTSIHVSILFQILFAFKLLQSTEQNSLCYTVGPCWLSVLNTAVCTLTFLLFFQADRASRKPCPAWVQLIHKDYIEHFGYAESLCSCYLWSLDFLVFILNMLCTLWDFSSLTRDWITRALGSESVES